MQVFPTLKLRHRLQRHWNPEISFNLTDLHYSIQVARSREEVDEALRMRFEVFNLELKEGLDSSYLTFMDEDKYDEYFDHLIIRDTITNGVIGTYRVQTYEMARRGNGFYSDGEFCLEMLGRKILHNSLELGIPAYCICFGKELQIMYYKPGNDTCLVVALSPARIVLKETYFTMNWWLKVM